ncbi:UDP-3-O-acyl-N-acetylglucosamine deacetylase [bacterium]|nr:UDP-3-O-acyl-N-acetylglucosamine deacetylase [bacterium]
MNSATISHGVGFSGRGLFSGAHCSCKIRPALSPEECERGGIAYDHAASTAEFAAHGILIEHEGYRYPALPGRYLELPNCTALLPPGEGGPPLLVIEHVFCALWAAGIDHCRIVVQEGTELPNHDGSALTLYSEIATAGSTAMGPRRQVPLERALRVEDDHGNFILVEPDEKLSIDYSFSHPELGEQRVAFAQVTREWASELILPARTFITQREGEALSAAGLLKNTHSEDALVIRPLEGGMVPESPLRFPDEYARHKVLDLIGDLYIVPAEWTGRVTAYRSGHRLNRMLAREMMKLLQGNTVP